jgi:hypothetical protein
MENNSQQRYGEGQYTLEELEINIANTKKRIGDLTRSLHEIGQMKELDKLKLEKELKKAEQSLAYYLQVAKEAGLKI